MRIVLPVLMGVCVLSALACVVTACIGQWRLHIHGSWSGEGRRAYRQVWLSALGFFISFVVVCILGMFVASRDFHGHPL